MAIVKDNILFELISGSLGDEITIYKRNGRIIMAKKRGPSRNKPTQKQLEARQRLAIAVAYAKQILKDPEIKAYYQAKTGPGQNAFNLAVKDAFNAPEVQNVEIRETAVTVTAKDEFRVAEVEVRITDKNNTLQEKGKAVLGRNGVDWYYQANALPAGGIVTVIAVDLPGNETVKKIILEES